MPLGTKVGLRPGNILLDADPASPSPNGHSPHFSAHVYCGAKRLDGSRCHLVRT